jgi:DNA repair protein RadC
MHNYTTAVVQLPLVRETGAKPRVRTPADTAAICSDLQNLAQESFQVLLLNSKNYLLNRQMVTLGLADASLVHPREVFRQAIVENSAALLLIHNHPSGDSTPSAEDIRITKQLIEAGRIIDIKILDHVIIGRPSENNKGYTSMREAGLCEF